MSKEVKILLIASTIVGGDFVNAGKNGVEISVDEKTAKDLIDSGLANDGKDTKVIVKDKSLVKEIESLKDESIAKDLEIESLKDESIAKDLEIESLKAQLLEKSEVSEKKESEKKDLLGKK